MKKRIIPLLLGLVCILFTFSGCGSSLEYALSINGTEITTGVYTYYLDYVLANADTFGITQENYKEDAKACATELVKKYIAVNTMANDLGVALSYNAKSDVAEETDNRWELFSDHYEKIGITKQDLHKIIASDELKMSLLDYYYGENSEIEPVSAKKLKNSFIKKYVGVKIIAASLTTTDTLGNTVSLDEIEMKNTRSTFENMQKRANNGTDIDTLYSSYNSDKDLIGTESLETYVFTSSSTQYGDDFFKKISRLDYGEATVIEFEDTIYLFYKVDITGEEYNYYYTYKDEVLSDLKLSELEEKITAKVSEFEVEEYSRKTDKIYKKVLEIHPMPVEETETEANQ